ncbi:IS481 family transposase [Pseudonocardia sulfidoxydans]|uniref:IS481 family transposase n=1 Tax=Pseudonocardia sulfidoxydans TaxID=54011 RepID=UPI0036182AC1
MELLKAPTPSTLEVLVSHRNAPLTFEGKRRLCLRVDRGRPKCHVAAEAGISRQCLHKWHTRWQAEGEAGLVERSSRPHRSPRRTPVEVEARIERLRRGRKIGPALIAHELRREDGTRISASGVHRVLLRLGISRLRDLDPPTGEQLREADPATHTHGPNRWRRYERARPGELVHIDVKKLGHIRDGGGWRVHGRGSAQARAARGGARVGYDYVHVAVDDHSRLAYVEVIDTATGGENQHACTRFLRHAAAFFADHGVVVERIMTDNAMAYRNSRLFAATCAELGIRQRFTKPRCPWTNGKAERFNRTLAQEWAYAAV